MRSKPILEENPEVDFCLHGEYELIFEHLAQYGLEKAPGTSVRDGSGRVISYAPPPLRPLDELPLPDRSTINSLLYTVRGSRKPQATIRVQRGCPFPCTYCLVSVVSGNKARHRSPESIANEMKMLMDQGISHFYLRADTFSLDKKWAMEVARSIARECPGARWVTTTRVECVDAPLLQAMRNAGCYGISFGLDVASEEIGVLVKKPPRLKEAEHALRTCDRFGIISLVYFMIGFIWESEQSLRETSRFIKQIRPDLITIHFAYPYPGTSYYEAARSAGFISDKTRAQAEPAIELPGFSTERLQKFSKRILLTHYLRPSVIYSIVRKMVRTIQVFSL